MSAVGNALKGIIHDVGNAVTGLGKVAEGVLTLNPSEIGEGVKGVGKGLTGFGKDVLQMTPVNIAGNAITGGALSKLEDKVYDFGDKVVGGVVDNVVSDVKGIGEGVVKMGKGFIDGDLGEVASGAFGTVVSGVGTVSDFTPTGLAFNTATTTFGAVVNPGQGGQEAPTGATTGAGSSGLGVTGVTGNSGQSGSSGQSA